MTGKEEENVRGGFPSRLKAAPVTVGVIALCLVLFLAAQSLEDHRSFKELAKVGYASPQQVWRGAWWSLVTTAFLHLAPLHLVFNLYWAWRLGSQAEAILGWWRYAIGIVAVGAASSTWQLAAMDELGVGYSGVLYGVFGFLLAGRWMKDERVTVLDRSTIAILTAWLFLCIALTHADILPVANAAHFGGCLLGLAAGGAFFSRALARLGYGSLVVTLLAASFVPLAWWPRSVAWNSVRAYDAHVDGRYGEAAAHYDAVLRLDPDNEWARHNRAVLEAQRRP